MIFGAEMGEAGEAQETDDVLKSLRDAVRAKHGPPSILSRAKAWLRRQLMPGPVAPPRPVRRSYRDSTQINIQATVDVTPWMFSGRPDGVSISGTTRVYRTFQPEKVVVTETVKAVYGGGGGPVEVFYRGKARTIYTPEVPEKILHHSGDAGDIMLVQLFSGADNCFPNAPNMKSGIHCLSFSVGALGTGVRWPVFYAGLDVHASFLVREGVLSRGANCSVCQRSTIPPGYNEVPKRVTVTIDMAVFGATMHPELKSGALT